MADAAPQSALHFVLIHGAFHGAWAWYRVEDALQKAGFKVSSMDMAGAGIHPTDPDTITTWEEYHKPALDFFASLPERTAADASHEKVVLVGHSMAGLANVMLMERFPHKIDLAVFVAALVVPSGIAFSHAMPLRGRMHKDADLRYQNGPENPPTSALFPKCKLQSIMYNGIDPEITTLASKLLRPYPATMLATPITYTGENHGQVPAVYIRYAQDNTLPAAAQDYVSTHCGPFREVVRLDGGHFDFLQRPKEFTDLLTRLANQYT